MKQTTKTSKAAVPQRMATSQISRRASAGISARRREISRGNVVVECALVPMFPLILGLVDIGMMTFRWATLHNRWYF